MNLVIGVTEAVIANGLTDNLITRAADVALKEKRKLIVVPRETPLNLIHLKNLKKLVLASIFVISQIPSFYNRPSSVSDIIDRFVGKLLDILDISYYS